MDSRIITGDVLHNYVPGTPLRKRRMNAGLIPKLSAEVNKEALGVLALNSLVEWAVWCEVNKSRIKLAVLAFAGTKSATLLGLNNEKIKKSNKKSRKHLSVILHLSPAKTAGQGDVCPKKSPGCARACLITAGHGTQPNVDRSRKMRTRMVKLLPGLFYAWLQNDLEYSKGRAEAVGRKLAIRPNGTADLSWENDAPWLFELHDDVIYYDYTKVDWRMYRYLRGNMPSNYSLTFSRTEKNWKTCTKVLDKGGNVAVVFRNDIPATFNGYKVKEAVSHDMRFLDRVRGRVLGLIALGKAQNDDTGFTVDTDPNAKIIMTRAQMRALKDKD